MALKGRLIGIGGGTSDHSQLINRDAANQHPISAIEGLEGALDARAKKTDVPAVDSTLTRGGHAADAATVGAALKRKAPMGMFTRNVGVNSNKEHGAITESFWNQIDDIYADMDNQSVEYVFCNIVFPHVGDPSGGTWAIQLFKSNEQYGFVTGVNYFNSTRGNIRRFECSKIGGEWQNVCYPHGIESTLETEMGCFYYNTADGEQEWVNPPMNPGVEYRTTARCNGSPVYVQSGIVSIQNHTFSGFSEGNFSEATGVPPGAHIIYFDAMMREAVSNLAVRCRKLPAFQNGELFLDCELSSVKAVLFPNQYDKYFLTVNGRAGETATVDIIYTVKYTK